MSEELERMRKDYAALKAELDGQKILNGRLMDKVFSKNVSMLGHNKKLGVFMGIFALAFILSSAAIKGVDMRYVLLPALLCLVIVACYMVLYNRLGRIDCQDNVLATVVRVRKFRKNYMLMNGILWLLAFGVLAFLLPVVYGSFAVAANGIAAVIFVCAIVVVCVIAQYLVDCKVLKACDEIIDRLNHTSA